MLLLFVVMFVTDDKIGFVIECHIEQLNSRGNQSKSFVDLSDHIRSSLIFLFPCWKREREKKRMSRKTFSSACVCVFLFLFLLLIRSEKNLSTNEKKDIEGKKNEEKEEEEKRIDSFRFSFSLFSLISSGEHTPLSLSIPSRLQIVIIDSLSL